MLHAKYRRHLLFAFSPAVYQAAGSFFVAYNSRRTLVRALPCAFFFPYPQRGILKHIIINNININNCVSKQKKKATRNKKSPKRVPEYEQL